MSRLAVIVITLTVLPWSGESFVSTIASFSGATAEIDSNLSQPHKISKRRARPYTRQQLQQQQQHPEQDSFSSSIVSSVISYRRSSSLLNAALITDPSSNGADKKGPGWHRRILGKISGRKRSKSSSSLPSSSIEQAEAQDGMVDTFVVYKEEESHKDFVVRNFDYLMPDSVLPVVQVDQESLSPLPKEFSPKQQGLTKAQSLSMPPVIDSEYFDVAITPAISKKAGKGVVATSKTRAQTKRGLVCRMLQNILVERLGQRWSIETPENLKVDVRESPDNYNNVLRLLFRGLFRAEATLSSDRIAFPTIRFSSIKLQMKEVTLNLMGFFVDKSNEDIQIVDNVHHGPHQRQSQNEQGLNSPKRSTDTASMKPTSKPRYPKQFDLHIEDLTMSRHDLLLSPCIKNGLRQLLINVLKDRGIRSNSIEITSIDILVGRQYRGVVERANEI